MISRTWSKRTPCSSARCELAWITGPSASGSENGTPTSTTSAPAASRPWRRATLRAGSGWPAVTYGTKARRPSRRSCAKRSAIASEEIVADPDAIAIRIVRLDDGPQIDAVAALLGQVGQGARMHQVAAVVADHPHDRARQHLRDRVHGVHDPELEGIEHDERPDRVDPREVDER